MLWTTCLYVNKEEGEEEEEEEVGKQAAREPTRLTVISSWKAVASFEGILRLEMRLLCVLL